MSSVSFRGKTAIITGAASGFGLATARKLAAGGATILAVDRNGQRLSEAITSLPALGGAPHETLVCDLSDRDAHTRIADLAFSNGRHVDILINSAGICHFQPTAVISVDEWDELLRIDLRSLYFLSVAIAEKVVPQRGCRIINLGSNAGRKGRPLSAHYAAAKAAVANVTESLALAYGPKQITVNTVCPAVVLTHLWEEGLRELQTITGKSPQTLVESWREATPLKRLGTPEDVANLIAFLASDEASFITGQEINVCGGFMLTC